MFRDPKDAQTSLVLVLGASDWPNAPKLGSSPSFGASASAFLEYVLSPSGLNVSRENVLNLFDDEGYPTQIGIRIRNFLSDRIARMKASALEPGNLILYYTGHGGFAHPTHDYYLALRTTVIGQEGLSSLRIVDLAKVLNEAARFLRRYLVDPEKPTNPL
jgi:hypothetical protein